jgi:hypothetical protein
VENRQSSDKKIIDLIFICIGPWSRNQKTSASAYRPRFAHRYAGSQFFFGSESERKHAISDFKPPSKNNQFLIQFCGLHVLATNAF